MSKGCWRGVWPSWGQGFARSGNPGRGIWGGIGGPGGDGQGGQGLYLFLRLF